MTDALTPLALPTSDDALAWVETRCDGQLERARELVAELRDNPPGSAVEVLQAWNDISLAMGNAASVASLFSEVHPAEPVRTRAETAMQEVQKLDTELGLDRKLYEVFAALDADGLDADATRVLEHTLRDFRRAGVDQDDATRERIRELNEKELLVGQDFGRGIRDDVRSIKLTSERLAGMPQDWIEAHPVGEDGLVTVTTDYPDVIPFRTYAKDAEARRELTHALLNIARPANDARLKELFALRQEHAELVGFDNWADYDADVKMIGNGKAIPEFVDKITAAANDRALADKGVVLKRLQQDRPDATDIDGADLVYYEELVRTEQLEVDAQKVRTYFDFSAVRQGLLDVTGRLFGLTYAPATDAVLWDDDVAAYEVLREGERIGRIYLDLHPREGKYKHAAQFDLVRGIAGRQLPEGVLVCNFPRGLMEHDNVVTLFHEFGHLLHHVLAGHGEWARFSGVATEWDFVEAPSQMLEEWAWDPSVLATFAKNKDGEPIPAELVEKMRIADDFGKGYAARTQMFYAALSYDFHTRANEDLTTRLRELQANYSVFPYLADTHFHCAFGHLDGYSSAYYTYMWSLVIAKDLFSAFDPDDLFDPEVAGRYRDRILAQGGRKDAADLVEDFLGRPFTFDAYAAWLDR